MITLVVADRMKTGPPGKALQFYVQPTSVCFQYREIEAMSQRIGKSCAKLNNFSHHHFYSMGLKGIVDSKR